MPKEGVALSPKAGLMTAEEIFSIAEEFVVHGVTKIRLTGGEPLVRKDVKLIMEKLSSLPVELTLTTNGILISRFIEDIKRCGIRSLNLSLDSLDPVKNKIITRRDYFKIIYQNILLLLEEGLEVKINCVLIKNFNDDEIVSFVELGKSLPLHIRFIEFMPFDGNKWNMEKLVSFREILSVVYSHYHKKNVIPLHNDISDTSKKYKIPDYKGTFAVISSVTNPFCDGCNRIRLTANGKIMNCLFSTSELDILTTLRKGGSIAPIIESVIFSKKYKRNGMNTLSEFKNLEKHKGNRSMITIGG